MSPLRFEHGQKKPTSPFLRAETPGPDGRLRCPAGYDLCDLATPLLESAPRGGKFSWPKMAGQSHQTVGHLCPLAHRLRS